MTPEERQWEQAHGATFQPQHEQRAADAYRKYQSYCQRIGARALPRVEYELQLNLAPVSASIGVDIHDD